MDFKNDKIRWLIYLCYSNNKNFKISDIYCLLSTEHTCLRTCTWVFLLHVLQCIVIYDHFHYLTSSFSSALVHMPSHMIERQYSIVIKSWTLDLKCLGSFIMSWATGPTHSIGLYNWGNTCRTVRVWVGARKWNQLPQRYTDEWKKGRCLSKMLRKIKGKANSG